MLAIDRENQTCPRHASASPDRRSVQWPLEDPSMTDHQLSSYRSRLREISSRTRGDVVTVREQALGPAGGQADGALSNAPMHLGDMGTETYLQELNSALLE